MLITISPNIQWCMFKNVCYKTVFKAATAYNLNVTSSEQLHHGISVYWDVTQIP